MTIGQLSDFVVSLPPGGWHAVHDPTGHLLNLGGQQFDLLILWVAGFVKILFANKDA
jgi:hypothetical protein